MNPDSQPAGSVPTLLQALGKLVGPSAVPTLTRAFEEGVITTPEIMDIIEPSISRDSSVFREAVQTLAQIFRHHNIKVKFSSIKRPAPLPAPAPAPAEVEQAGTTEVPVPPSPIKAADIPDLPIEAAPMFLEEHFSDPRLSANGATILKEARDRGVISLPEIRAAIREDVAGDPALLRSTMMWMTQVIQALHIQININERHVKAPTSTSANTSYSVRADRPNTDAMGNPRPRLGRPPKANKAPTPETKFGFVEKEHFGDEPDKDELCSAEEIEALLAADDEELIRYEDRPNAYQRAVRNHSFLPHDEILALARQFKRGADPDSWDYEARNKMVVHNLRWVLKIAHKHLGRGIEFEDLVQEGNIGLMKAADRFDPDLGFHFLTYATWWIRQHMQRYIQDHRSLIRIPNHVQETSVRIFKTTCAIAEKLGREPTLEEIAAQCGETVEKVRKTLEAMKLSVVSLEELAFSGSQDGDTTTIGELQVDRAGALADTILTAQEDLSLALGNVSILLGFVDELPLSDRDKEIFRLYYGLTEERRQYTLKEIGDKLGVTRERIRQINAKVWAMLQERGIDTGADALYAEIERIESLESFVGQQMNLTHSTSSTPPTLGKNRLVSITMPAELVATLTLKDEAPPETE